MKWTKVKKDGTSITTNGWHICHYKCGEYMIINDYGKFVLTKNGNTIGTFKTLKIAKAMAEQ